MSDQKNKELESIFQNLCATYQIVLRTTAGTGTRGDYYIQNEYEELEKFVGDHPEFKNRLPQKHKCDDDGTFGMATGMAMLSQFMNRQ